MGKTGRTASANRKSVDRREVRKAVLEVKAARAASARKGTSAARKASASFVERYLGHFGVGSTAGGRKGSSAKGTAGRKTAAKKSSGAKSVRRAS